jgi:hypothetical protein
MKFPEHLTGPQFADGNLVSFIFDESELILRAQKVPHHIDAIDEICRERDFRNADTTSWDHFGTEGHCSTALMMQTWEYVYSISRYYIAHAELKVDVVKHSDQEAASCFSLNNLCFRNELLSWLKEDHAGSRSREGEHWPSEENNDFLKSIPRDLLDGLQIQLDRKYPAQSAFFPLGRQYMLRINFNIRPLHYPNQQYPYSEKVLQQFKLDAFDDFTSHIRIEYTPETIALIQKLKENQQ